MAWQSALTGSAAVITSIQKKHKQPGNDTGLLLYIQPEFVARDQVKK